MFVSQAWETAEWLSCDFESHWNHEKALFCSGEAEKTLAAGGEHGVKFKARARENWGLEGGKSQTGHHTETQGIVGRL